MVPPLKRALWNSGEATNWLTACPGSGTWPRACAGQQLLDDKARQYLGISGEEFRTRWEAGEIDADDEPDVMRVAMLLPLAG